MGTAALFLVALLAAYTACRQPPWLWAVFVAGTAMVELLGRLLHFDIYAIPGGILLLRATDGALFGLLVGVVYHARGRAWRELIGHPLGGVLTALFSFLVLKLTLSVLLSGDQILANRNVSHALGGLAAALGDLRDGLLPLLTVFYAYVARRSCDLRRLGWPVTVGVLALLLKGMIVIGLTGHIFTGTTDTEDRFIPSYDAITLTIFGFMLLFLRAPRLTALRACTLGCFSLVFATIANHRSQWIGMLAGLLVLVPWLLLGRPILRQARQARLARVALSGVALSIAVGAYALMNSPALQETPFVSALTIRLLAFTNPSRDPTSEWREEIWRDRITQVGSNWPWGRPLGDRRESLFHGTWINLPDHSAYVTLYELGGVILCGIMVVFALRVVQIAIRSSLEETDPKRIWPPVLAVAVLATSLAYGSAYLFPILGLPMMVVLLNGAQMWGVPAGMPAAASARSRRWTPVPTHSG